MNDFRWNRTKTANFNRLFNNTVYAFNNTEGDGEPFNREYFALLQFALKTVLVLRTALQS